MGAGSGWRGDVEIWWRGEESCVEGRAPGEGWGLGWGGRAGDWGGGRGWRGSCLVLMRSVSCRDRIKGDILEPLEKTSRMAPIHLYTNVYTPILSSAGFHLNRVSKVMFRKYIF